MTPAGPRRAHGLLEPASRKGFPGPARFLTATAWLLACTPVATGWSAAADTPCIPVEGLQSLLTTGTTLVLGELHGTIESPAFTLDVACHATQAKLPVIVGLELRSEGQVRVDTFLDSPGSEEDRAALLAGPSWQSTYQDGRNSQAMLDSIDGLRRLRAAGAQVRVTLFDAPGTKGGQQRERDMARNLAAAIQASPGSMVIVLTGNLHSRVTVGSARDASYEPMGYLLARQVAPARLVSLDVGHGGGSAWICAPDCGVVDLGGRRGGQPWTIEIDDATRPSGHAGWYHVGAITASLPARMAASVADGSPEPPRSVGKMAPGEHPGTTGDSSVGGSARESSSVEDESVTAGESESSDTPISMPGVSAKEAGVQGTWQAYDFGTTFKTWLIHFDEGRFHAQGGADDWYEGRVAIRTDAEPAEVDFLIEDCRCSYKGMTSRAIYLWDGESLVLSAPAPGGSRPDRFEPSSGQMMRLLRQAP